MHSCYNFKWAWKLEWGFARSTRGSNRWTPSCVLIWSARWLVSSMRRLRRNIVILHSITLSGRTMSSWSNSRAISSMNIVIQIYGWQIRWPAGCFWTGRSLDSQQRLGRLPLLPLRLRADRLRQVLLYGGLRRKQSTLLSYSGNRPHLLRRNI
jgi:hypothetical protein